MHIIKAIVATIFIVLAIILMISVEVEGDQDIRDDWEITSEEAYDNETITVTGNVIIEDGGLLSLDNVTLEMNCYSPGQFEINVTSSGELWIKESTITFARPSAQSPYKFFAQGKVTLIRSEIINTPTDVGTVILGIPTDLTYMDLRIRDNDEVSIIGSDISNMRLDLLRSEAVIDNAHLWIDEVGQEIPIWLNQSTIWMTDSEVNNGLIQILMVELSRAYIDRSHFHDSPIDGIRLWETSKLWIKDSLVENNAYWGIMPYERSSAELINVLFFNNWEGNAAPGGDDSYVLFQQYLDLQFIDETNDEPIGGVNYRITNAQGLEVANGQSDENGSIPRMVLPHRNFTSPSYYLSPYTVHYSATDYVEGTLTKLMMLAHQYITVPMHPENDIYASDISISDPYPKVGDTVDVIGTITNTGSVAVENFNISIYEGHDDGDWTLIKSISVTELGPRDSYTLETSYLLTRSGENIFRILVDSLPPEADQYPENNMRESAIDVRTSNDPPIPILERVGGGEIFVGSNLTITGEDSSDDTPDLEYRFEFGDGNSTDWSRDPTTAHSYMEIGEYLITLWVKDLDGVEDSITKTVSVIGDETPPIIMNGPDHIDITDNQATIVWETDEPTTATINYGTTTDYDRTATVDTFKTDHSIRLTNLLGGKTYHYEIIAWDAYQNGPTSTDDNTFTTQDPPDSSPPVYTEIQESFIDPTDATISWTTDEPSTSILEYGMTGTYWTMIYSNQTELMHTITLTDLEEYTLYHYRIKSWDNLNNGPATTSDLTFKTKDGKLPTVTITVPQDQRTIHERTSITAEAEDENGIYNITLIIDNDSYSERSDTITQSIDPTDHPEGPLNITATAMDNSANQASSTITLMIDNQDQPNISVDENNDVWSEIATITGTAIDPDGWDTIERIEININQRTYTTVGNPWTIDIDVTNWDDGEYNAEAFSYDGEEYSESFEFTIEVDNPNKSPTASILVNPTNADEGQIIQFIAYPEDQDGTITQQEWISSHNGLLSSSEQFSTDDLIAGTHDISYRCKDNEGTWSMFSSGTITIREIIIEPELTVASPRSDDPTTISGSSNKDDIEIQIIVSRGEWRTISTEQRWSYTIPEDQLQPGTNTIFIRALDPETELTTETYRLTIDITKESSTDYTAYITAALGAVLLISILVLVLRRKR